MRAPRSRSRVAVVPAVSFMVALLEATSLRRLGIERADAGRQGAEQLLHPLWRENLKVAVLYLQPGHLPDQEVLRRIPLPDVDHGDEPTLPIPDGLECVHESVAGDLRRLFGHPTEAFRDNLCPRITPHMNRVRLLVRV